MTVRQVTLLNNFSNGSQGTTVVPGNSGSLSGTPFDTFQVSAGATLTYDSTFTAHYGESFSCKVATVASGSSYLSWSTAMLPGGAASQAQVWFRAYLYLTATPSVTTTVFYGGQAGTTCGTVKILTSGKVAAFDASGTQQAVTTATVPANQWVRLEAMILGDPAAGQLSISLFTVQDSTSPVSGGTASATGLNTNAAMTQWRFGQGVNLANVGPYWMADCGLSNSGAIGPVLNNFNGIRIDGGECATTIVLPPQGAANATMAIGGDVEGFWTSTDAGQHWQSADAGLYATFLRFTADTQWSLFEPGTLYSCNGNNGSGGGFMAGTQAPTGQWQWQVRNGTPQYASNGSSYPGTYPADPSRPTGHLLCQVTANLFYTATYAQGVYKSTTLGSSWTNIGLGGGSHFCRTIAVDPNDNGSIYVGVYNEGLYLITGANTGSPSAPQLLSGAPQFPEDIVILGNGNIYVAAGYGGSGQAGYAPGGIWTSTTATAASAGGWSQFDAAGSFLSSSSWWFSIDGYTDNLGGAHGPYDQLVVGCNKAIKPSGATSTRNLAWITVSTVTGTPVFSDISTTLAQIQSADIPPLTVDGVTQGRTNWHAGSGDALGHNGMIQPRPVVDKTTIDSSNVTIWCPGSGGCWVSTGNTVNASGPTASPTPSWTISNGGMQMFISHSLQASPGNPLHLILGSSDQCAVDISDGTAYNAATTTVDMPAGIYRPTTHYGEGYALAFDALSEQPGNAGGTVYLATGHKYNNDGGQIWARPGTTWSASSYVNISVNGTYNPGTSNGQVAYGLCGGRYRDPGHADDNTPYLLALIQGASGTGGMWRFSGYALDVTTGALTIGSGTWAHADSTMGTAGGAANQPNNSQAPILIDPNNTNCVYAFDQNSGIWRSTNYGKAWTQIWSGITVQDPRTGYLAINPTVTSHTELWVSFSGTNPGTGGGGLFYIPNADTVSPGSGSSPPSGTVTVSLPSGSGNNPGGITIGADGTVYCLALQVPDGPYKFTQLLGTLTKGATWFNCDNGSVASTASKPSSMVATSNGRVYIGNDANVLSYGYPAIPQATPAVGMSATASMTAQPQDSGGHTKFGNAGLSARASMTAAPAGTRHPFAPLAASASMTIGGSGTPFVLQEVTGASLFDYGCSTVTIASNAGNTLLVLAGWDLSVATSTGAMPATYVTDSAGNLWYHIATTTSSVTGARCTAWIAPNASPVSWVSVSMTTFASSLAFTVLELNGQQFLPDGTPAPAGSFMPPYYDLDVYDAAGQSSSASLSLAPGFTTDDDFAFAVLATGSLPNGTGTPSGWTPLNPVVATPTTATTPGVYFGITSPAQQALPVLPGPVNPVSIYPYYQIPAERAHLTASWTLPAAAPVAGIAFAVKSTVNGPYQPNPSFPVVKVEAGFGTIPGDPTQAPPSWTDITNRVIAPLGQSFIKSVAGRQYELAQAEAGTLEVWLDNHDGAFTPGNTASPFSPNVVLGVPLRVTAWWDGVWYSVAYGFCERWPQEWPDLPQWGISKAIFTDAISVMAAVTMDSALDSEVLLDGPWALFPAGEQYLSFSNGINNPASLTNEGGVIGSFTASDAQGLLAQNYSRVNQRTGMYVDGNSAATGGQGNAIAATGQTTSLLGSAGTGFGTTAITAAPTSPNSGPGIIYTDPNMPDPVTGPGVTVSFWVIIPAQTVSAQVQPTVFTAYGVPSNYSVRPSLTVQVLNFTGSSLLQVTLADGTTVTAPFAGSGNAQMVMLVISTSSLSVFINGALAATKGLMPSQTTHWNAVSWGCPTYAYGSLGLGAGNFTMFGLALTGCALPAQRAVAQLATGLYGQQNVDAITRVAQILAWAGLGIPKGGQISFNGAMVNVLQGPAYNLAGTTASDALNQIAVNENSLIAAMPGGSLVFFHQWALFNLSPVAVLGDNPDPTQGQVPYLPGQSWGFDNTYLYNLAQITQQYGPNNLITVTDTDFASDHQYYPRTALTQTITTMSALDAYSLVEWIIGKYSQPSLRVSTVTVDASSNPNAAFPVTLSLLQGQVVTVTRSPVGGATITQDCIVEKVAHAIGPASWSTAVQASPYSPEDAVLQLDNPSNNTLGTNVLP